MKRKIFLIILVVLIVLGGFVAWRINQFREQFSLDEIHLEERMLTTVQSGSIRETIEMTGNLSPIREKTLSFPFSTEVIEVIVEDGEVVEKGQLLFRADETRQRLEYLRAKTGYENALIHGSSSEIEEQKLNLELAEADLSATELKAPFAGVITEVLIEEGDRVSAEQEVASLIEGEDYKIEVEIDEVDLDIVEVGQEVVIGVDAVPGSNFGGEIEKIAFKARQSNGSVSLPATVIVTETHERFRPGLTAELEIIIDEKTDILTVPISAIYTEDGQDHVLKVVDGEPVPTGVETGIDDGIKTEITGGLQEGERILINAYMMGEETFRGVFPMGPGGRF